MEKVNTVLLIHVICPSCRRVLTSLWYSDTQGITETVYCINRDCKEYMKGYQVELPTITLEASDEATAKVKQANDEWQEFLKEH